jgi:hypothetical protein
LFIYQLTQCILPPEKWPSYSVIQVEKYDWDLETVEIKRAKLMHITIAIYRNSAM